MKRNAIVRIVIYSVLILLLLGILLSVMNLSHLFNYWHREDVLVSAGGTATVVNALEIRESPSRKASIKDTLDPGDKVTIKDTQTVNGVEWGHVEEPETGWICMEDVKLENTSTVYDPTDIPADQIHSIDIDWAAGDIVIKGGDTDTITVRESKSNSQKPMVVKVKNGNLEIDFHEGELNFGFGINMDAHKDLTITVPKDHPLLEIELDIASAEVEIRDLAGTVDEIDIDAASGTCTIENCTVRTLDVDTASGDVSFRGSLDSLNFDAASAEFVGVFVNHPRNLKLDSMSGDMEITLPAGCGFTATVDALSSRFTPDQDFNLVNGAYVHGDGYCRIDVSGMSGDVKIHQGK